MIPVLLVELTEKDEIRLDLVEYPRLGGFGTKCECLGNTHK